MKESDIRLINEWQAGDISAFDKLVESHRKQTYQLAYHITGNHEDANDISQEAFIRAYSAIGTFKRQSSFATWLRRITVNLSINHLKRERYRQESSNPEVSNSQISILTNNPLQDVEAKELAQRIEQAISSLPVVEKVIFILRVHQGLSYKEIARTLGCPAGTVMSRLNRARRRLRDKLRDCVI